MRSAERGLDNELDASIAFHVSILRASQNPFYAQFRDVVSTALQTSTRFANHTKKRTASAADHAAVYEAIVSRNPSAARKAMKRIIDDAWD